MGTYSSPNGKSYTFNADPMTYEEAEAYCQTQNSHLASYASLAEQNATESFLIDLGVLLPGYHTFYWIGLNTSRWPNFRCGAGAANGYRCQAGCALRQASNNGSAAAKPPACRWIDGSPRPRNPHPGFNTSGAYDHWGYYMPQNIIEPNDFVPHENCVGANYTEAWGGAWGWADANCFAKFPALCMTACGCQGLGSCAAAAALPLRLAPPVALSCCGSCWGAPHVPMIPSDLLPPLPALAQRPAPGTTPRP